LIQQTLIQQTLIPADFGFQQTLIPADFDSADFDSAVHSQSSFAVEDNEQPVELHTPRQHITAKPTHRLTAKRTATISAAKYRTYS
jgi:hypothetical protein